MKNAMEQGLPLSFSQRRNIGAMSRLKNDVNGSAAGSNPWSISSYRANARMQWSMANA
jgi:hypothetical protein